MSEEERSWRLDLDSLIIFSPEAYAEGGSGGDEQRVFWSARFQHEVAHWTRWQSTSVGLALTLMRRAAGLRAQQSLAATGVANRRRLIRIAESRPIWSRETDYEPGLIDEDFALNGQFWLDLDYAFKLLFEPAEVEGLHWFSDGALSSALTDAWLAAGSFPSLTSTPDGLHVDELLTFGPTSAPLWFSRDFEPLSTRGIWESACTLDELREVAELESSNDSEEYLRLLRKKLSSSRYGGAWAFARQVVPGIRPHVFQALATISCDPPMPFLGGYDAAISFEDIYPPARLARLCSALSDRSSLLAQLNRELVLEEEHCSVLAGCAGLAVASWPSSPPERGIMVGLEGRRAPVAGWQLDLSSHPGVDQPVVGHANARIRASIALRSAFKEAPDVFLRPSIRNIFTANSAENLQWLTDSARAAFLLQPFIMDFADGVCISGFGASVAGLLTEAQIDAYCSSLGSHALFNAFLSGRPVRTSGLPRSLRSRMDIREHLIPLLRREMIVPTNW